MPKLDRETLRKTCGWRGGLLGALALLGATVGPAAAQSLTPRAFWPAPRGVKVVSVGLGFHAGELVTDPSLPIEEVEATVLLLQTAYVQFFSLAGRTASVTVAPSWADVSVNAFLEGEARGRDLSGLLDLDLRLAVNLIGAASMSPAEFREFLPDAGPLLGASLRVRAPTGAYDSERLLNLGSHRWSVKPELGFLRRIGPDWIAEAALGAWFYADNPDFLGQVLEQDPLVALELHFLRPVRRTQPDFWASLDLNFYAGGRTRVGGVERDDLQRNSRIGATVVFPFAGARALKLAAGTSLAVETGGDYTSVLVAYQQAWR